MITFTLCLLALIAGYFTYGRLMERVFGPDDRKTPALTKADGVDYIPLPTWKIFMIQFLNIAGLGPIFGAIMGAKFGSSSYLWIVLGSIFAGAVHDYFAGMLSLRHGGESLPEIIGRYLGLTTKQIMRGFTVLLMILVGSVFVAGPAGLLAKLTPESLDATFWIVVVGNSFGYNNLVVDFRNIPDMLKIAPTVVMDCTHSVQRPGAAGGKTGGNREFVPAMAHAAKAFGANGFFFEVHPDPDKGLSDAANMLRLDDLETLVKSLL